MRFVLFILFCCAAASPIRGQKKIDHEYFRKLFSAGNYQKAYDDAKSLRDGVYGKCPFVDFYIGKSLCLSGNNRKADEWFQYILDNYPIDARTRLYVKTELTSCGPLVASGSTTPTANIVPISVPLPRATVSSVSKSAPNPIQDDGTVDCFDTSHLLGDNQVVDQAELESRLFDLSQSDSAVMKVQSLAGDNYIVRAAGRVVLATPVSMNVDHQDLKQMTLQIDKALLFFNTYYNLRVPDKLLTIYLVRTKDELKSLASRVHNLKIPSTLYGYSIIGDLSLLAIADPTALGTIYHELFHLVVRTDIGDLPAWLDEGMASLYSVSRWKDDVLVGEHSWRLDQLRPSYLRSADLSIPSLKALVGYDWLEFNGGSKGNLCKAAVNYSLSNYFLLYVQEKGKLQQLVSAYKNRPDPGDADSPPPPENTELIGSAMRQSFSDVSREFEQWLEAILSPAKPYSTERQPTYSELQIKTHTAVKELKKTKPRRARKYEKKLYSIMETRDRLDEQYRKKVFEESLDVVQHDTEPYEFDKATKAKMEGLRQDLQDLYYRVKQEN